MIAIRAERADDAAAISDVIGKAFAGAEHSDGNEAEIVQALRESDALTVSLVAMDADALVGHIALSPVSINGQAGWIGLGPVSVLPTHQCKGIGAALVREGLSAIRALSAKGCVVLGDPEYYSRFGFRSGLGPTFPGAPEPYFMALPFGDDVPAGAVQYHAAFDA